MKKGTQYYFFSGKGGVGKTSLAAAAALQFSRKGENVLLISTDPAHSLSDSFETPIGGVIKKLAKNLSVVEIDPVKAMEEYKERLSPHMEKLGPLKGLGLEGIFDIAGTAPGIDEIAAFDKFLQYLNQKEYDIIVFDTAPTGHVLRFLSLPDVLDSWVGKLIAIRLKIGGMVNLFRKILPFGEGEDFGPGMEQLEKMKKRIQDAKVILSDPKKTRFWLVLLAEQMSIFESERARKTLAGYGITVSGVVVNQLVPKSSCSFCSSRRAMQERNLVLIREKFKGVELREIPLFKDEVKGIPQLEQVGRLLSGGKAL